MISQPTELERSAGRSMARWYVDYYRRPDHPMKLRVERLMRQLLRLSLVRAASPSGIWYELLQDDHVQQEILRFGAYEPESLRLMQRLLQPGDTMVDVGGHVGQFALHAAQCVGESGTVVAIEPNPQTYQFLQRNIVLNGFQQVIPVLGAVAASAGVARMVTPADDNWGASRVSSGYATAHRVFHALTMPLQALLGELGVRRVDVLKIDVEGFESQVISSLDLSSALRPRHIILEFIPALLAEQGESAPDVAQALRDAEYELLDVRGQPLAREDDLVEFNLWARDRRRGSENGADSRA